MAPDGSSIILLRCNIRAGYVHGVFGKFEKK
jgi:hypothetical protein